MKNIARFNYAVDLIFLATFLIASFSGLVLWGWGRPVMKAQASAREVAEAQETPPQQNASDAPQPSDSQMPDAFSDASEIATDPSFANPEDVADQPVEKSFAVAKPEEASAASAPRAPHTPHTPHGAFDPNLFEEPDLFWGLTKGNAVLGMDKGCWKQIHIWISVATLVCFLIHLWTHFKWLVAMSKKRPTSGEEKAA